MENKLFAVYLGGRAPKCNTELHDVVFVVGTYTGLAMAFNSFGLQLDPELREIATASHPHFEE